MNNEPIRVAYIVGKWVGGGVESVIMNYYRHIDRTKVQIDFICDNDSTLIPYDEITSLGGRVILVPPYQKLFKYIKELKKIFKENSYKIVHSHINTLSVFPLYAAKKSGVPIRIAHSHSTYNWAEFKRTLLKFILRPFSKVYATDYFACGKDAGNFLFGKHTNYEIIYNAIELDRFKYNEEVRNTIRKELNIDNDTLVFGHAGRFVKTKNHEFLIESFNEYHKINPNSKLLLIGKGELEDLIKSKVLEYDLSDDIMFLGYRNDINCLYQAMDVFLLPSLYEGLGMTLIEAEVSGLTCIASTFVPSDADISGRVIFEELDIKKWANDMSNIRIVNRNNVDVDNCGYSIEFEAIKLTQKYIDYSNR